MKSKTIWMRAGLCLVLCSAMLLCGCAKLHTVVLQGNTYVDKKTGAEYTALSACYEPVMRGEEYAVMDLSGVETILYEMGDFSPEEYLCTAYNDVFCADAAAVPSFDAWDVAEIYVCTTTAMTAALLVLDGEEGGVDAPLVWALRDAYVEGARVKYPSYYTVADSYTLRFTANNVPGLYYCITYVEYAEDVYDAIDGVEVNLGRYFIYDRYNKVCVAVGDALHERLGGVQYDDAEDEYDA